MRYIIPVLSLLLVAAKTPDTFLSLQGKYATAKEKILCDYSDYNTKVHAAYVKILETEMNKYKAAGRLNEFLELQKEHTRVSMAADAFVEEPKGLTNGARAQYRFFKGKCGTAKVLRDRKIHQLNKAYVYRLQALVSFLTRQGKIPEAARVKKEMDQMAALVKTGPTPSQPRKYKEFEAEVFANGDDDFIMYLNGQLVLSGTGMSVSTTTIKIKHGDVLTVKSTQTRGDKGFACVIRASAVRKVYTTPGNWKSYFPEKPDKWFLPEAVNNVKPVVPGNQRMWKAGVESASGRKCESIWSIDNSSSAYMTLQFSDLPKF